MRSVIIWRVLARIASGVSTEPLGTGWRSIGALEASSHPMGFNLGMNQGAVAGAGVAAHLHQHVVPRWGGDANFLPVIAQTKALPMLLEDVRSRLVASWPGAPGQ